jgi:serine phosphatase RsbU (regulator of sigma subunit)
MTRIFNTTQLRGFGFFQESAARRSYKAGEVIFRHGDLGDAMYIVVEGEVKVTIEGRTIDRLMPGSVLGEMALIDAQPRSAAATAATDCTLVYVDYDGFVALTQQYPNFAMRIMQIMSNRLRRFMTDEVRRQRLEEEMLIGKQIQLSLLPERCPQIPGWEFAALYRAAQQVGGDLYDFVVDANDPQRWNIVIADVTGKGVPAALFMAMSRTMVRAETANGHGPATILKRANSFIIKDAQARLFLSMFYGALDTSNGRFTFSNGGHEWPLLWRANSRTLEILKAPGFLLGVLPNIEPVEREAHIAPGDFLILYTDGVTEARNEANELFGEERLYQIINSTTFITANELLRAITTAVAQFSGDTLPFDDFTLVVIRRQAL